MSENQQTTQQTQEPRKPKYTRLMSVVDVLKKSRKAAITREELIKKADQKYSSEGGSSNEKESRWATNVALQVLTAYGAVQESDEGISKTS